MSESGKTQMPFGELVLSFSTRFQPCWNDRGSSGRFNGSFFLPIAPSGFHALAGIGLPYYGDPNGNVAALCVKEAKGDWPKPALVAPLDFAFIWNDRGTRANSGGTCWRPLPPPGYVALGDVMYAGYGKPSTDIIRCVAEELCVKGSIGEEIWTDWKTGANSDFGSWQIDASGPILDTPDGVFSINSFIGQGGRNGRDKPTDGPVVYNLRLPLPTEEFSDPGKPALDSRNRPPGNTNPTVDRVVTVPFTSILDNEKSVEWRVHNSAFYTVERVVDYRLVLFIDNVGGAEQTASTAITTGISTEESETFSHSTGISITASAGIESGGFNASTSVTMNYSFGYSTTSTVTQFRQETDEVVLVANPETAAAVWVSSTAFQTRRADKSLVSAPLGFDPTDTAYSFDVFPKKKCGDDSKTGARWGTWRHRLAHVSERNAR